MRFPFIASAVALLLGLLVDWLIYKTIPKLREGKAGLPRKIYAVSAVLTLLLLIVIFILPHRSTESGILHIMWMLYTWATIYIAKFIYLLIYALLLPIRSLRRRPLIATGIPAIFAVLGFVTLWWGAAVGRRSIDISDVTIASPRLPAGFDGMRIVQFSDAHVGTWGNDTTFVSDLVDKINSLHPDMIVFTGDIVNRQTEEIYPFINTLSRLKAPLGVYSIMGNHDYGDYSDWPDEKAHRDNTLQLREIQKKMGWRLLDNEHVFIKSAAGDSIALIGVENWGEPPFKQYGDLHQAYPHDAGGHIHDDKFKILLTHNPMHWHEAVRGNTDIDLTLSGHTHAMQFLIGGIGSGLTPASLRYPEWGGLYTHDTPFTYPGGNKRIQSRLYVNIGCGEVAIPARIGATPEITLITLRR